MNRLETVSVFAVTLFVATACQTEKASVDVSQLLDNCPVVGEYVQIGDDKVLSCDQKLLTDTIHLPLSFFTEEMEIIKLDDRDEALVGQSGVIISDNYILVQGGSPNPYKLFDRKGNFLTNIGAIGQGPGEYNLVYNAQLDEANDRIYLMPWQSTQLLAYDLKGNVLAPIPLCLNCPKAKFKVDTQKGLLFVVVLPFKGSPAVAWTQDLKGNRISYIEPGHLEAPQDFSNEVISGFNMPDVFDVNILCIMPTRVDSLYRYDSQNNRMRPTFTLNHTHSDQLPWHGYGEWPGYFTGNTSEKVEVAPGQWSSGETIHYIIDKETCKGAYFTMYNDYFGDINIFWPSGAFANGYFAQSIEPGNLLNDIETGLSKSGLSDVMRQKLTDLKASIQENGNNYILLAHLKQ